MHDLSVQLLQGDLYVLLAFLSVEPGLIFKIRYNLQIGNVAPIHACHLCIKID